MALLFAKNNSLSAVTALPASVSGGGLNLISTQTASSSATLDFTSGIDSTYKEYVFLNSSKLQIFCLQYPRLIYPQE